MTKRDSDLEALQRALDEPPYQKFLGLEAVAFDLDSGTVTLKLPFKRELCRSADRPEIHGGVTAALIDIAGDYALAIQLGEGAPSPSGARSEAEPRSEEPWGWGPTALKGVPTVDLRVDFLRMAVDTELIATAKVVKNGRTLGVVNVEVTDAEGRLVAVGRGTYYTKK